ncbi:MAG: hypothetical protein QXL64_05015, partial [Thermofilaceae archaeon]
MTLIIQVLFLAPVLSVAQRSYAAVMPAPWRRRGFEAERRLVKLLSKRPSAYVFRVPVSGSRAVPKAKTALPDVFMVDNVRGEIAAFEVKATSKSKVAVKAEQLAKLFKFL